MAKVYENGTDINSIPRPIKSELKSKRIIFEQEKPIRWSFLKFLRENSTLKEFYPEINPYVECYKVRDNTWALYSDSVSSSGDVWMYLVEGPKKALLIDTAFGVGDLKGLVKHLTHDKELIVCNTHAHGDHSNGNAQFDEIYCHEYEVPDIERNNNPHVWDRYFNMTDEMVISAGKEIAPGMPIYTEFDPKDLISYKHYDVRPLKDGEMIDLGDGYLIEAILLPGHTPGQCGYLDRQTGCFFIGDTTILVARPKGTKYREYTCPEAMAKALRKLKPRFKEISGVFPGHGMLDQSPILLQYLLDTCEAVIKDPDNFDREKMTFWDNRQLLVASKNIYQWTAVQYDRRFATMEAIIKDEA